MAEAVRLARQAGSAGEVPVGAVLVRDGRVLASAQNRMRSTRNPLAHAELLCLARGARRAGPDWRLLDCTLYVTLEPCPMCAGAVLQARVGRVVYGARQPRVGADGSWVQLLRRPVPAPAPAAASLAPAVAAGDDGFRAAPRADGDVTTQASTAAATASSIGIDPSGPHPFHANVAVEEGCLADECSGLMRDFFRLRRHEQRQVRLLLRPARHLHLQQRRGPQHQHAEREENAEEEQAEEEEEEGGRLVRPDTVEDARPVGAVTFGRTPGRGPGPAQPAAAGAPVPAVPLPPNG